MYSCYYTSRVCKYFVDGECYENYTTVSNASTCDAVLGGYFLNGRCYYRVPLNCSAGHYLRNCTCYPRRSSVYSDGTCRNIGGFHTDDHCYYMEFNCVGYAVNDQCYTTVYMYKCFALFLKKMRNSTPRSIDGHLSLIRLFYILNSILSVWFISQLPSVLRFQPWTCCQHVSWYVPFSAQDLSLFLSLFLLSSPLSHGLITW